MLDCLVEQAKVENAEPRHALHGIRLKSKRGNIYGLCINEVAAAASGFGWSKDGWYIGKTVRTAADCPKTFSRALAHTLLRLNDYLNDDNRQKLLPFALQLAGSADTLSVEVDRIDYMRKRLCNEIGCMDDPAKECVAQLRRKVERGTAVRVHTLGKPLDSLLCDRDLDATCDAQLDIVRGAFKIGNQAPPLDPALVARARVLFTPRPAGQPLSLRDRILGWGKPDPALWANADGQSVA